MTAPLRSVMVRYKTAAAHADDNAGLIRAVFTGLAAEQPRGMRYTAYVLADGVTFIHVASSDDASTNPLRTLPAFAAFQKELHTRCVEPPVVTEMSIVGSYTP